MEIQNGTNKRFNYGKTPKDYTFGYKLRVEHLEDAHRIHDAILAGEIDPFEYGCENIPVEEVFFNKLIFKENHT